jgi:hypothetical protein
LIKNKNYLFFSPTSKILIQENDRRDAAMCNNNHEKAYMPIICSPSSQV